MILKYNEVKTTYQLRLSIANLHLTINKQSKFEDLLTLAQRITHKKKAK